MARMPAPFPLAWLPAAAALMPLLATAVAWTLSVAHGHIEACNVFWDGCTSISRAARHGLGNHVFRALVLPCAMLQILFWWLCQRWLRLQGRDPGMALPVLGLVAGAFLILYATFLGTDGSIYQLLRRYGVIVYFAATYLALLLVLRQLARGPADRLHRPLLIVALVKLGLGLATVAVSALVVDEAVSYRWENVLEWQLGIWLTVMFALFAWRWRGLAAQLHLPPPR